MDKGISMFQEFFYTSLCLEIYWLLKACDHPVSICSKVLCAKYLVWLANWSMSSEGTLDILEVLEGGHNSGCAWLWAQEKLGSDPSSGSDGLIWI